MVMLGEKNWENIKKIETVENGKLWKTVKMGKY